MKYIILSIFLSVIFPQISNADEPVVERRQLHMGTYARVLIYGGTNEQADSAFLEIKKLDDLLSDYNPDSEISLINSEAGKKPVHVSPETLEILTISKEVSKKTRGEFDPTIGALTIGVYRFGRENKTKITDKNIEKAKRLVDYRRLNLTEDTAYLEKEGMMIDLGGIGKGYAIDKAAEALKGKGVTEAIVSLSGDVRVFGKDVPMGIREPSGKGAIATFNTGVQDLAISTSGSYERKVSSSGNTYHHLIVPESGWPGQELLSVTVVMPGNNTLADAYATAIFVMGKERALEFLEQNPEIGVFLVYADGTAFHNKAFSEYTRDLKVQ